MRTQYLQCFQSWTGNQNCGTSLRKAVTSLTNGLLPGMVVFVQAERKIGLQVEYSRKEFLEASEVLDY